MDCLYLFEEQKQFFSEHIETIAIFRFQEMIPL